MTKRNLTIALLLTCLASPAWATVQGTSITAAMQLKADSTYVGHRIGVWYNATDQRTGTYAFPIFRYQWADPDAATSHNLANALAFASATVAYTCDEARTVQIWPNFTSSTPRTETVNSSITLTGTSIWGNTISEIMDFECTSVTAFTEMHCETKKAFKTVTAIALSATTTYGANYGAAYITLDIGYGNKLGLPYRMAEDTRMKELIDADGTGGATLATAGTVVFADLAAVTTATGDWRGTWKPNTIPAGTADYVLYYIPTDITQRYDTDPVRPEWGR